MEVHGRHPIITITFLTLVLALGLMAGCGGKGATTTTQEPSETTETTAAQGARTQKVLVVLADRDFNEVEGSAVIKGLGTDFAVVVANASGSPSVGDSQSSLPVDTTVDKAQAEDYAGVVIVGGMGATQYFDDPVLQTLIREMDAGGKVVAAICISPVILAKAGVLRGKKATVSPGMEEELAAGGAVLVEKAVVQDGKTVTAWGPDAAMEFARTVAEALKP